MKASELDKRFDNGEDLSRYLEFSQARRLGVPRQSIIKVLPVEGSQTFSF